MDTLDTSWYFPRGFLKGHSRFKKNWLKMIKLDQFWWSLPTNIQTLDMRVHRQVPIQDRTRLQRLTDLWEAVTNCWSPCSSNSRLAFSALCWWKSKVWTWPVGATVRIKLNIIDVNDFLFVIKITKKGRHRKVAVLGVIYHKNTNLIYASIRSLQACKKIFLLSF